MIYIMLGGPATGKGTRSEILSDNLGIPHISTGEILRTAAERDNELNKKLTNGELISDEIINELLYRRLIKRDCAKGFILDGYPRRIEQVYALEAMMRKLKKRITKVIELVASEETVYNRVLGRRECSECSKSFGIDFPSINGDYCDECGGRLIIRSDDTKETLKKRIDTYAILSKPILEYYRQRGMLKTIDSTSHPRTILDIIKK